MFVFNLVRFDILMWVVFFFFAAPKPKKWKKMKEKKRKMSETAEELQDTEATLPQLESCQDNAVKVSKKKVKAYKKLKFLPDSGLLTETVSLDAAVATNESNSSVVAALDRSSRVKRLPAKSNGNSGVVRIIEKSQHKQVLRTENIEEALQLDVGVGSCQW